MNFPLSDIAFPPSFGEETSVIATCFCVLHCISVQLYCNLLLWITWSSWNKISVNLLRLNQHFAVHFSLTYIMINFAKN